MCRLLFATNEKDDNGIINSARLAGFDVTVVKSGDEAVDECKSTDYDAVLLNTALPEPDGFAVCREIRKTNDVPVIFVSASGSESDKILGFEAGADDFFVRPISFRYLLARINAIIFRRTGRRVV